jgi:hypothetical protein
VFRRTSFLFLIAYETLRQYPPFLLDAPNDQMIMEGVVIKIGDPRSAKFQSSPVRATNSYMLKADSSTKVPVYVQSTQKCDGFYMVDAGCVEQAYCEPAILPAGQETFAYISNPGRKNVEIPMGMKIGQAYPIKNTSKSSVRVVDNEVQNERAVNSRLGLLQNFH